MSFIDPPSHCNLFELITFYILQTLLTTSIRLKLSCVFRIINTKMSVCIESITDWFHDIFENKLRYALYSFWISAHRRKTILLHNRTTVLHGTNCKWNCLNYLFEGEKLFYLNWYSNQINRNRLRYYVCMTRLFIRTKAISVFEISDGYVNDKIYVLSD